MKYLENYTTFIINEGFEDVKAAYKSIDYKKAATIIKKNCKDFNKNKPFVYRGFRSSVEAFLYSSDKVKSRKSANTENYFTMLIDNSPEWDKFPKRSKSIICTVDEDKAGMYGEVYVVIPFDGVKIAVCPTSDIWRSFKDKEIDELSYLNEDIDNVLQEAIKKDNRILKATEDFSALKDFLSQTTLKKFQDDITNCPEFWGKGKSTMSAFDFLNSTLTPDKFKLIDYNKLKGSGKNEVYFEGNCVLIKEEDFQVFAEKFL